jgi:hypothetical protein
MRWIFLLLLAANIGYVAWELKHPETQRRHVVQDNPNVPKLVLLSELGHAAPFPSVKTDEATNAVAEQKAEAANTKPDTKPDSKTEKAPEPALAEKTKAPPAAPLEPKPPAKQSFACYTLGPFRDIVDLRKLTRDIRGYVVEASYRSHEEREQSMYWVYLPKQKSREAANALAASLKRKGIHDYYVVNKGDQANAISLGHFKEKKGALRRQKNVKAAGFSAQIDPVFKTYTIYWLDYRVKTDRTIPQTVLNLSNMPGVSRLERSCQ